MRLILYLGQHGLIFVLAKSAVLIAPLLAAGLLSQSLYGTVEWWLALSLSFGPLLAMGAPGLIAYGTLGDKFRRHVRTATVFVLIAVTVLLLLALAMPLLGLDWKSSFYGPVALQCAVVALQMTLSARLKGLGKGAWASLVESTLYLSLLCALLLNWQGFDFILSFMGLLLFACSLLIGGVIRFLPVPSLSRWQRRNYRAFLRVGLHFMAGSTLMGIFMALPRISLGLLASPEKVAEFALVFRWLSISIVAHQFISTVFFRTIFTDIDTRKRDRMLSSAVLLVAFGTVSIVFALYIAQALNLPLPIPTSMELVWSMSIVMVMWSATACFEGSLYREGASLAQIRAIVSGLFVQILVLALVAVLASGNVLLYGVSYAWLLGLVITIAVQNLALRIAGQEMFFLLRVVSGCLILFVASAFAALWIV
ncbi:hypothetical protein DNJ95_14380 [Stutzerimonas kirkiae]|uniref:Uncharacterized protein n=1 Tax=Stutzerimonas kirkiae TaxID=2211392 RepID=A0A4V2KC48_9GAMM|nr:hypothetical protein DNJ96_15770 [Stutzerimonas kirkiae]TBV00656.1 hypothetical protein DNJ95_14380 [Stutzerimonas kirkiae]TBV10793.1 hypothetical protein DNK08_05635 [Stutzerimonas kirkiae]